MHSLLSLLYSIRSWTSVCNLSMEWKIKGWW